CCDTPMRRWAKRPEVSLGLCQAWRLGRFAYLLIHDRDNVHSSLSYVLGQKSFYMLRYCLHSQTRNRVCSPSCSTRGTYLQVRFIQNVSPETRNLLHRIYKESQHHRVRQRAHCILLSSQGINTTALMTIFSVDRITLYNWFDAWEAHHFAGLYDKKRCERPPKLTNEEQSKAQQYLTQHPRDIRKVVYL